MKAQYGILRFKKYKGPAISPIEAHNERTKEQYASNPDIDTSRSRYNLHLVQPQGRYREEADRMIAAAHCRVRKDSVRVVEALVTASPELVGAMPLHLAVARPFCRLKSPLGTSLFRCASQTRSFSRTRPTGRSGRTLRTP